MSSKLTRIKSMMDLIRHLSAKQVSTLREEKITRAGGKRVAIISMTVAIKVLDTRTREMEWRVKTRAGGVVSKIKEGTITIKVIGHRKIKAANQMIGIRIAFNIKTMVEMTNLCKRMATIKMTDGQARSTTSKGTPNNNSNITRQGPITTIRMIISTNSNNMVDEINTAMGTKMGKITTMLKLIPLSRICSSIGPSKKKEVFMALIMPHSSIQHQSTTLQQANHKVKGTSLKLMNSRIQILNLNSLQNQLRLFLISPLRIAPSPSPSSLDQALALIHSKLMNWQKTLILF